MTFPCDVTDANCAADQATVTIAVTGVNAPVEFAEAHGFVIVIEDNTLPGVVTGTFTATDVDLTDTVEVTMYGAGLSRSNSGPQPFGSPVLRTDLSSHSPMVAIGPGDTTGAVTWSFDASAHDSDYVPRGGVLELRR